MTGMTRYYPSASPVTNDSRVQSHPKLIPALA